MAYYEAPHAVSERELDLALTIARQLGFSRERLRAEQAKELLLHESKHRITNTLATGQAIAGHTLRNAPREDLDRFLARLHAIDKAHDLLTAERESRKHNGRRR
jgi:two-component sensor histidine kinase